MNENGRKWKDMRTIDAYAPNGCFAVFGLFLHMERVEQELVGGPMNYRRTITRVALGSIK